MQMDVQKAHYPFYTIKKMIYFAVIVTKNELRWQQCQVYGGKLQNMLSADFSSRVGLLLYKEANCHGV